VEFYFDLEEIKNAGGAVYSKYGTAKNSKDLKLPEELKKALTDDTWIREVGPGTIALESGDLSAFEEQLIGEYKGDNCLQILRMCNLVGKDSAAYVNGLGKLWPYNMVNMGQLDEAMSREKERDKPKYAIDVRFPDGFDWNAYRKDSGMANMAEREEKACNKEEIIKILKGQGGYGRKNMEYYLSPFRRPAYKPSWNELSDCFERYSVELKSRVLDMYLDISAMDEVSPHSRYIIYNWAAKRFWEQPYPEDKVKACRCYTRLAEKDKDCKIIYNNILNHLCDNKNEESFLILKRLDSYDVPEAPYYLGIKYMDGLGCERDYQEAKRCFVKGTGQGPEGLRELCSKMVSYATRKADSYELFKISMKKLETDLFEDGFKQLKKLADVDKLEEAQYELAKLYENGYKVQRDNGLALEYYEKAATTGYETAMRKMIHIYEEEQLGLDGKSYYTKKEYPEKIEMWKKRLKNRRRKDYPGM